MTIRERKQILYFLEVCLLNLESHEENQISEDLLMLHTRGDIVNIVSWLYPNFDKNWLLNKSDSELQTLLKDDANILTFCIENLKKSIHNFPKINQEEVGSFFEITQNENHYLASKPFDEWDGYDLSNYHSLLRKTGFTKRVYGIFSSDVLPENAHNVTTKPSFFFDTKEEAETALNSMVSEGKFSKEELIVHSVWV